MTTAQVLMAAGLGAVFQEALHWYGLRDKLHLEEYRQLLRSVPYWVVTVLVVVGSTIGTYLFYHDTVNSASAIAIMAAGFPLVFKKSVGSFVDRGDAFGAEALPRVGLKEYFKAA